MYWIISLAILLPLFIIFSLRKMGNKGAEVIDFPQKSKDENDIDKAA